MPFVHGKCDFYQVGDAIKNHFYILGALGSEKKSTTSDYPKTVIRALADHSKFTENARLLHFCHACLCHVNI